MRRPPSRRALLLGATAATGASALGGCDRLGEAAWFRRTLKAGEDANLFVQRLLLTEARRAPEYAETDISPWFKPNGTEDPPDRAYKALAKRKFADYRLEVGGLVETPFKLSLAELRSLPARTQITRHDCVEGWSCIGKWTGVPLSELLNRAVLKPQARYVVFYCADTMDQGDDGGDATDEAASTDAPAGNANPSMAKRSGRDEDRRDAGGRQASDDGANGGGESQRHRPGRAGGAVQADECFRAVVSLLLRQDDPGFAAAHWLRVAEFVTAEAFAGRTPWTSARSVTARAREAAGATTSRAMQLAAAFRDGVVLAETGEPEAALARFERVAAKRLDRHGTVDDPFGIAQRAAVASGLAAAGALCALRVRGPLAAVRLFERARVRLRRGTAPAAEVDRDLLAAVCPPGGALVWLFASSGRAAAVIGCRAGEECRLRALDLDRLGGLRLRAARNRWLAAIQAVRDPDADQTKRRARMARTLDRLLTEIGVALAQPLDAELRDVGLQPGAEVVLVSSGAASLLPLHAAPLADGQPFIARYALRSVPFVGLSGAGAGPPSVIDRDARSLILADPTGLGPGGVREADRLVGLFRQAGRRLPRVVDTPAGPRALARVLAGARRVHVTAHGAFGFGDPLRSRLALDGQSVLATHLLAGESLRDCGLMFLASCESALADAGRGDDLLTGLAASVLDLGAATVIGALWPMADGAAAALVAAFYRHHLGGAAPVRALRAAMLEVRATFPHPLDWAPFLAHGR